MVTNSFDFVMVCIVNLTLANISVGTNLWTYLWGIVLLRSIKVGIPTLNASGVILWIVALDCRKGRKLNMVFITHYFLVGDSMWPAVSATPTITSWDRLCFWTVDQNKSILNLSSCVCILSQRCWRQMHSELHRWSKYKPSDADDLKRNKAQIFYLYW